MSWPNVRDALKTYLRADAGLIALIPSSASASRTFFGVPKRGATYPLITLPGQVGGGQDGSQAPIDRPLQQLDIFGGDLTEVHAVESAVRDALAAITAPTTVGSVVLYGVNVVGAVDAPDEDDRPRRVLTLETAARAA